MVLKSHKLKLRYLMMKCHNTKIHFQIMKYKKVDIEVDKWSKYIAKCQ
jgi:hypothetical protein